MMVWSINLLVLSIGILIVGLIKPKWIMFWMETPARLPVVIISSVLFMVAAVMFGEANKENQENQVKEISEAIGKSAVSDTPAPIDLDEIKTDIVETK